MTYEQAIAALAIGDKALDAYDRSSSAVEGYRSFRDGYRQIVGAAELRSGSEKMVFGLLTGVMACWLGPALFKKGSEK